jgi:Uma2 family endonuclease
MQLIRTREGHRMSSVPVANSRPPALLEGVSWRTYSRMLRAFAGDRRLRFTYDRGSLEIMVPLLEHEGPAELLGWLIKVILEELNLPARTGGSVTLRRRKRSRGLEPDRCYWIASAGQLQGKQTLDLRFDPPPDLAVEVDVTSSSIDRMSIYAALCVPEVWRLTREGLAFYILEGNRYQVGSHSLAFAWLAAADLMPFLELQAQTDDTAIVRQFREWVRRNRPSSGTE